MRTIKSFEMFIGESVTSDDLKNNLLDSINEGEVIPGVQLNPSEISLSKLKNNFYVRLSDDEVQLVGIQKDSKAGEEQQVSLTFLKNPVDLPDGNVKGKVSAFMSLQPLTKTGNEAATKYLNNYIIKTDGSTGKLSDPATATNLLGGFLFASGTYLSDSSFKNLLSTITYLRYGKPKPQAKDNPVFVAFFSGLANASASKNAFTKMKESNLSSVLSKRGGENFKTAFDKCLADYKKSEA